MTSFPKLPPGSIGGKPKADASEFQRLLLSLPFLPLSLSIWLNLHKGALHEFTQDRQLNLFYTHMHTRVQMLTHPPTHMC